MCYTTLTVAVDSGLAVGASNEDSAENEAGGFTEKQSRPHSFCKGNVVYSFPTTYLIDD